MMLTAASHTSHRMIRLTAVLLCTTLLIAGCGWFRRDMQVSVPVMPTAAEQYKFAVQQRDQSNLAYVTDKHKLATAREVIRQTLACVPANFPDDRKFTPLAKLDMIEMQAGLDHRRASPTPSEIRAAIQAFDQLSKEYPEYEFLQARSLYNRGLCHKQLGEFRQSMDYFRQVRDTYGESKDPVIAGMAKLAGAYYNNIYVED